jgi:hypothetical protein
MAVQRSLAILATLILTGCGAMPNLSSIQARNDFKGKPLSAVTAQLGYPDLQETIGGQKSYVWRRGTAMQECRIRVVMAGDIVDTYGTSGDAPICSPYLAPAQPVPQ